MEVSIVTRGGGGTNDLRTRSDVSITELRRAPSRSLLLRQKNAPKAAPPMGDNR